MTPRDPDVEIGARVTARRLRFHERPQADVQLHGEVHESGSERENLPEQVEPGVTYRDVRVRWRAQARVEHRV
jgi:hypothetical protein